MNALQDLLMMKEATTESFGFPRVSRRNSEVSSLDIRKGEHHFVIA
jgi:hypothetical protein